MFYEIDKNNSKVKSQLSEVEIASSNEIKLDDNFKKLRDTMKNGFVKENMFQINKLTDKIVEIIIRLYHVNIQCVHEDNNNSNRGKLTMMSGILEDNDGKIYVTISEDPREDEKFYDKLNYFIKLLHKCNIEIIYPEYNLENKVNQEIKQQINVGSNKKIDQINNTEQSISKINITQNGVEVPMFYNVDISTPITVNLINSILYLDKRKNGEKAFDPFPKSEEKKDEKGIVIKKEDKSLTYIRCNNGSTCTESKLFSYLYDNGKKWSDIKGGVAYWIKNNFPPEHITKNYNYDEDANNENSEDNTDIKSNLPENELHKLTKLSQLIYDYKRPEYSNNFLKYINNNENYNKILKSIFRPIALPCPGCYMNFRNGNYQNEIYISGTDYDKLCRRTFTSISNRNNALDEKFNDSETSFNIIKSSAEKAEKAAASEAVKAAKAKEAGRLFAELPNGYKLKYLKYKNKYLALKKKLELNNI